LAIKRKIVQLVLAGAVGAALPLLVLWALQSSWIVGPKDVLRSRGRLYVIGTGPAGPQMATLQALETMKKMDVILAPKRHAVLFARYIGDKPNLFNPWAGFFDYKGKRYYELDKAELAAFEKECFRLRDERVKKIKRLLDEGKDVGLLDSGDPCVFGPSHWYIEQLPPEDVWIVPGLGAGAAALAALRKSVIPAHKTRFVVQTAPFFLLGHEKEDVQVLRDLARYDASMVYYMALEHSDRLFDKLRRVFPADTPCAAVYWAGFPLLQKIVRGNVGDMGPRLSKEKEKYMGMLFVGRFLAGKPYESAMRESLRALAGAR
jgi:precorrin-4 methylase